MKCSVCQSEVTDYVHIQCLAWDERGRQQKWCEENDVQLTDMCAMSITFYCLLMSCPTNDETAAMDWSEVTIFSHPYQKQMLNACAIVLEKDADALELIKAFWQNVKWITDVKCFPSTVEVQYQGKDVTRIINLEAWRALSDWPDAWKRQKELVV